MIPSEEVLSMVKRHIVLTLIPDVLKRDAKHLQGMKMPSVLTEQMEQWTDRAFRELYEVRRFFREHDVKVYEMQRLPKDIIVKYVCKGYRHEFGMLGNYLRAEIERQLIEWRKG